MAVKNNTIEGSIESVAFGGDGILRHQGRVVFVPYTLMGDQVRARVVQEKKSFARASLEKIIVPSPDRRLAPCEYFGRCGGCQLQHAEYNAQLEIKKTFVSDALSRIGKMSVSVKETRATMHQWRYRRHIRLHWKEGRLGFVNIDQQTLLEVTHCPIFADEHEDIIQSVKRLCSLLQPKAQADISIYKAGNDFVLFFDFFIELHNCKVIFEKELANIPYIKGIVWKINDMFQHIGNISIEFSLNALNMKFNPKVFVQAHPEQSAALYMQLKEIIKAQKVHKVLDLYCGFGATSLLLRQEGIEVCGIEFNPESIRLARDNEASNNLNGIEWHVGDVDKLIDFAISKFRPDCVLVNPPRTGLSSIVLDTLKNYLPDSIVYVSCMPATLARDSALLSHAYDINYCEPFDMFPQTTHVETLVKFEKKIL